MQLSPEEMRLLLELSEPLEQSRRPAFLQEATRRIEETAPQGAVGPGVVHRVGRAVQRDFFNPPICAPAVSGPEVEPRFDGSCRGYH